MAGFGSFVLWAYDSEGRSTIPNPSRPQDCPWCAMPHVSDCHIGVCAETQAKKEIGGETGV